MGLFNAAAALIALAALFSWLNNRFIRLPGTIAMLLFSLATSIGLVALGKLGVDSETLAQEILGDVQLDQALLGDMLSFLLFAGALRVNLREIERRKWAVGFLASLGVVLSTALEDFNPEPELEAWRSRADTLRIQPGRELTHDLRLLE